MKLSLIKQLVISLLPLALATAFVFITTASGCEPAFYYVYDGHATFEQELGCF
jgi:hypothetical protein